MRRIVFLLLLSVVCSYSVPLKNGGKDFQPVPINPVDNLTPNGNNNGALLSGQLFKTVKRYHCSLSRDEEQANVLLYGTNGWIFPQQDVNLTLSYPTANQDVEDFDDYVIIGYEIILFMDGVDSSGFITAGGLLRNDITLNFIMRGITMLSYEFWLFGVPTYRATAYNENFQMC